MRLCRVVWDTKYRPLMFAEVLGQEGPVQVLQSRLRRGTALDTSYIFSGGHGTGKSTLARILARSLLCRSLQDGEPCNECESCRACLAETSGALLELDAASKGTIDNIRRIVADLPFVVPGAAKRIYIIDECHRMSRDAQDVLLKPIEDKQLVAILCTTEPERIRGPIRSRCEEHPIHRVSRDTILGRATMILDREGVAYDPEAVLTVIDYCTGHVRDALNKLEMIAQLGEVSLDAVKNRLGLSAIATYYQILLALGQPRKAVEMVEEICDRVGPEETSAGLAEAAMNSYRLAHKMHVDFAHVDRDLAEQVHQAYGDGVVGLAEYFLEVRRGRTALICSVVRCLGGVPREEPVRRGLAAPVVELKGGQEESGLGLEKGGDTPVSPQETHTEEEQSTSPSTVESGEVGPYGTRLDAKAIPSGHPRRREDQSLVVRERGIRRGGEDDGLISTAQWRTEFETAWRVLVS